jgi:hypothetical protein
MFGGALKLLRWQRASQAVRSLPSVAIAGCELELASAARNPSPKGRAAGTTWTAWSTEHRRLAED